MRVLALCLALLAPPAAAQSWGNLDTTLFSVLTRSGTAEASFWLPNNPDPAQATEGLGVVYEWIQGSAGSVSIAVGYFSVTDGQLTYQGAIEGLFGNTPRETAFLADRIEVTTTTLRPGEPRCCPTGQTRWIIDRTSRKARAAP